jgi:hypothetical protein
MAWSFAASIDPGAQGVQAARLGPSPAIAVTVTFHQEAHPMQFRPLFAAMSAVLLLAACQTGDKSPPPVTGGPAAGGPAASGPAPRSSAERNAVAAFGRICAILDRNTVVQRAAQFGFAPARNDSIPADLRATLDKTNGQMFIRPAGAPAMLLWSEPQTCELWVGGVEVAGMEQEFSQLLGRISDVPNSRSTVARLSPEEAARMPSANGSRVRQGAFIAPRDLVATPPRVMVLRSTETPGVFQALMIHRVAPPAAGTRPGAPAPTATSAGPPKDPVR